MLRRTRLRLALWSGGTTLLALLVLGFVLYSVLARQLAADSEHQLRARADLMYESGSPYGPPLDDGLPFSSAIDFTSEAGTTGYVFGGPLSGTIAFYRDGDESFDDSYLDLDEFDPYFDEFDPYQDEGPYDKFDDSYLDLDEFDPGENLVSASIVPVDPTSDMAGLEQARLGGGVITEGKIEGTPVRLLTLSIVDGQETFAIQVLADRTDELRTLGSVIAILMIGIVPAVLVAALAGWTYAGRALVPIRDSLRHQREFAADASHELRTPLAIFRSTLEVVKRRPPPDPAGRVAVEDASAEADRMTRLVDDLLLLARADADAVPLEWGDVDLADEAAEVLERLSAQADQRRITMTLDVEPAPLRGDRARLRQLVTILVDNALHHGHEGGHIWVTVRPRGRGAALVVADDGPGIAAEELDRVFERFWRSPEATADGSGLGLAIARWISGAHGGTISAGPRTGGGARFEVVIPS